VFLLNSRRSQLSMTRTKIAYIHYKIYNIFIYTIKKNKAANSMVLLIPEVTELICRVP